MSSTTRENNVMNKMAKAKGSVKVVKTKAATATATPKSAKPKSAKPKAATPKSAKPKAAKPKAATPKSAKPKSSRVKVVKKVKDVDEDENEEENMDTDDTITSDTMSSEKKNIGKTNNTMRDLNKIIEDPEKYAKTVPITKLVTVLQKLSEYYYVKTEPLVDDDTFDTMVEVLKERDPNNAFLFQTGAPTTARDDVKLPYGMPSLDKIKPGGKSMKVFFTKYHEPFEKKSNISYIVDDKLDGVSGLLNKDKDGNVDMFTKTQTLMGKSKKHLIKYLFKDSVLNAMPKDTAIRFEILIARKDFKEFEEKFKNPRNTVAGFANTDKIDTRLANKMQAVVYGIINPRMTYSEQLAKLKEWGFKTVWNRKINYRDLEAGKYDKDPDNVYAEIKVVKKVDEEDENTEDEIIEEELDEYQKMEKKLEQILKYRRAESEFDCDGIVLVDDSKTYVYDNEKNPTYSVAFKKNMRSDMKDCKVVEIIWEPSMYSILKPVIKIEPMKISGVTVTYATGHNGSFIANNFIGPGAVVKISRSGDVIPYIEEVITKSQKPLSSYMPKMKYEFNETGVDIICLEPDEETSNKIQTKRNLHFFRTLGVKYLSEGIMKLLYDNGYKTIFSIIKAASDRDENPYKIRGLGAKMMTKIYTQIDKSMTITNTAIDLPKFMSGSLMFGMGIGVRKLKDLVKHIPDILGYSDKKIAITKILEVPGFSNLSAEKVANGINDFYNFIKEISENTKYKIDFSSKKNISNTKSSVSNNTASKQQNKQNKQSNKESDLSGKKVVLTGFRDKNMEEFIEANGGSVASSVSSKTDLVVYVETDPKSAKLVKAETLNIPLMKREEFSEKYM